MSALEDLQRARARIDHPSRWTQFEMARNGDGALVVPESPSAVCWCAVGALRAGGRVGADAERALYLAAVERGAATITDYNDAPDRTHAEILGLYGRAGEIAVARGPTFAVGRELLWAEFGLFCSTRSRVRVVASCPDPSLSAAEGPVVVKTMDASGRRYRTRANDLYDLDCKHVRSSQPQPPNEDLARATSHLEAEFESRRRAPKRRNWW